jgi:hypothetical protein
MSVLGEIGATAMRRCNLTHDGEAESRTVRAARHERLEDAFTLRRVDAGTIVDDFESQPLAFLR